MKEEERVKLAKTLKFTTASYGMPRDNRVWQYSEVDVYSTSPIKEYRDLVKLARFFYQKDSFASTVINKMVEITAPEIRVTKGTSSENELKLFRGLSTEIEALLKKLIFEYLLTGLAIPEVVYGEVDQAKLKKWGVVRREGIQVPVDMWVLDSSGVNINYPGIGGRSSYYMRVPEDLVSFIQMGGKYPDFTEDKELLSFLNKMYPQFVKEAQSLQPSIDSKFYVKVSPSYVMERKRMANAKYPVPYLATALEYMKHKRALRKMDYSLASRVITAIQVFRLGNDNNPLTEGDEYQLEDLRNQMYWRDSQSEKDVERIYQLFGNHTLDIEWVMPDIQALLDDAKYATINQDILISLGFPRTLITGEAERTGSSDPEYAILSPIKTMEDIRDDLYIIVEEIFHQIVERNGFRGKPVIQFSKINLHDFLKFFDVLIQLYQTGNISRQTLVEQFGYDLNDEFDKRKDESEKLTKMGIQEFAPVPHSTTPEKRDNSPDKTGVTDTGKKKKPGNQE